MAVVERRGQEGEYEVTSLRGKRECRRMVVEVGCVENDIFSLLLQLVLFIFLSLLINVELPFIIFYGKSAKLYDFI